jgi:hypothetical protein
MPTSIAAWEQQQWGVFVAVIAAGLLAAILAPVAARWRLHHPYPAPPRPRGRHIAPRGLAALYPTNTLPVIPGAGPMPQAAELIDDIEAHLAAGPGSLTSLREVGPGAIAVVEPLVDLDVAADLGAALDAALEAFRVGTEPAMRTARRWMLQGGETYAAQALRRWHIEEITGEWPMVRPVAAS